MNWLNDPCEKLIQEKIKDYLAIGSKTFHHIAIQVGDIKVAVAQFKKLGIELAGEIVGERGSDLRQVFTKPDTKNGKLFTVLEIAERRRGYEGFLPPQANKLMESTRAKRGL
jgi:4-hydroxyphenylpyruvate dioxygenase-like putative hemolysin